MRDLALGRGEVGALLLTLALVALARAAHARVVGDLGHRHVPPALVVRHARVAVDLDVDDDWAVGAPRARERSPHVIRIPRPDEPRAEAFGVGREVDRELRRKLA